MSSLSEELKKGGSKEPVRADEEEHTEALLSSAPKNAKTKAGATGKKKPLAVNESPVAQKKKSPVTVYLDNDLYSKVVNHRFLGKWKSETVLLEHIIREYYETHE